MSNLVTPVLIGAGVWVALDDDKSSQAPAVSSAPSSSSPAIAGQVVRPTASPFVARAQSMTTVSRLINPYVARGAGSYSNTAEQSAQQALSAAQAKAKAAYNALSADAKKKGAAKLSDALDINPPLKGTESWEEMGKRAGAAAGAAACGAIPGAQVAIPLCSICGAYLGVKLADFMGDQYDKIADYVEEKWDDAKDAVTDFVGDTYDTIKGWF